MLRISVPRMFHKNVCKFHSHNVLFVLSTLEFTIHITARQTLSSKIWIKIQNWIFFVMTFTCINIVSYSAISSVSICQICWKRPHYGETTHHTKISREILQGLHNNVVRSTSRYTEGADKLRMLQNTAYDLNAFIVIPMMNAIPCSASCVVIIPTYQ